MNKKRKREQSQNIPERRSSAALICNPDSFKVFLEEGYVPLTRCPEVQMCISAYAEAVANMTLHLMANTERGDVRIQDGLSRKLDINPKTDMTHQTFFENIVRVMMETGNQVTLPVYEGETLRDLLPVRPSAVSFKDVDGDYRIMIGGKEFRPDEVLHFPINPDPERPYMGTGFTAALRDVVKSIRQTNATKQALMESPKPSLIIKVDAYDETLKTPEGRKQLARQYIGDTKNGEPWFLQSETMSVETVKPLTLNDLAIDKSLELDKRSIAAIIGVPAFMVGVGNFDAKEFNWWVTNKVMRPARIIQQEMTRKLLVSPDRYLRFNARSLMSYDIAEVVSSGKEMVDRMALRRNEWRDWLGFPPDADMDEILALENFLPVNKLGDQKKLGGGTA